MKAAIFGALALTGILASGYFFPIMPISVANAASKPEVVAEKGPSFVKLPRVVLPIVYNQKIVQMVEVNLIAEVPDEAMADKVKENEKKIQSALFSALHGSLDESVGQRGEMVDINKVKRRAAKALATVVGKENVNDLLVDSIRQRKS